MGGKIVIQFNAAHLAGNFSGGRCAGFRFVVRAKEEHATHAFTTRAKNQGIFFFVAVRFSSRRREKHPWRRGLARCFSSFGLGGFVGAVLAGLCRSSMVAGVVGGTTLAFVWPFVFYLNIRTGGLFVRPPIAVDDLEDVTERTMSLLMWGKTFAIGALGQQPAGGCGCVFRVPAALSASPRSICWLRGRFVVANLSVISDPWHCRYVARSDSAGYLRDPSDQIRKERVAGHTNSKSVATSVPSSPLARGHQIPPKSSEDTAASHTASH